MTLRPFHYCFGSQKFPPFAQLVTVPFGLKLSHCHFWLIPLLVTHSPCYFPKVLGVRAAQFAEPILCQRLWCSVGCFCYNLETLEVFITFFSIITSAGLPFSAKPPVFVFYKVTWTVVKSALLICREMRPGLSILVLKSSQPSPERMKIRHLCTPPIK